MLTNQFVIFSDNGTDTELSKTVNDYRNNSATLAIVAADDALYIGSDMPFNHRYFEVSTANDQASTITAYTWWDNAWCEVALLRDYTLSSGATLAQNGIIEWTPDREKGWSRELDSEDVTGLAATTTGLYNMYWLKLVFSADLANTTAIKYIGHKFTEDNTLFDFYPDLNNTALMTAFETGKTSWSEQHFAAAEAIVSDLRRNSVVRSSNQILNYNLFEQASVYKTAELIYQGLGTAFREDRDDARKLYSIAMKLSFFDVDTNANATLDDEEKVESVRYMTR